MSKSNKKKEEKSKYETPVVVKLDGVDVASGQVSTCCYGASAGFRDLRPKPSLCRVD
jgi:hypothetical protein